MVSVSSFGLKRLYDWVISWARTSYASPALFLLAFAESSFFPVPPDVLLVVMGIAKHKKVLWYAFIATLGSVVGGMVGYYIGSALFVSIGQWILSTLHLQDAFVIVGEQFQNHAFLAILGAAFTPIPYKVFTIAAGFWKIGFDVFVVASVVGRGARFFLEGFLLYFFGEKVAKLLENYFGWVTAGVFVFVMLAFLFVKMVLQG